MGQGLGVLLSVLGSRSALGHDHVRVAKLNGLIELVVLMPRFEDEPVLFALAGARAERVRRRTVWCFESLGVSV